MVELLPLSSPWRGALYFSVPSNAAALMRCKVIEGRLVCHGTIVGGGLIATFVISGTASALLVPGVGRAFHPNAKGAEGVRRPRKAGPAYSECVILVAGR